MRPRLVALGAVGLLPSPLKQACYRLFFGYRIGKRVRIGFTLIDVRDCEIGDDVEIGHLNVITQVKKFRADDHVRIGHLNMIRGGDEVSLGRYAEISRMNEINSIPNPRAVTVNDPRFSLGAGSAITTGHKIDFTDRVQIGRRTVIGGRNSSVWTHNRQRTYPVSIGSFAYVGSEIRMAPGSSIPSHCIVGIGSVIAGAIQQEESFIAGVPAKVIRPLGADDRPLLDWTWRVDLPEDV